MNEIEMLIKLLDSMEGLSVNLKVGKESELVIKGDLLKIVKVFGALVIDSDEKSNSKRVIGNL